MTPQSDALTFRRFVQNFTGELDLSDICSEIRRDPEAPTGDKELLAHLESLFVNDPEPIRRLWRTYRKEVRRTGARGKARGHS